MNERQIKNGSIYRIDKDNNIAYVCNNYILFAKDNYAPQSCVPPDVIGKNFFDFIKDKETKNIYYAIIETVRIKKKEIRIPLNCDSPNLRRFIETTITPLANNYIEFVNMIIRVAERNNLELLDSNIERSNNRIRICSFCKKVDVSKDEWVEVEEAITILNLFNDSKLPALTHGVCPICYEQIMYKLKNSNNE